MKYYIVYYILVISFIFSGCSIKKVYEPKLIDGSWEKYESLESSLIDSSLQVAIFDDGSVISKTDNLDIKLLNDERIVFVDDKFIVKASIDGNLTIITDNNTTISFELKQTIATASIGDGILAVLFSNNQIALYDIFSKAILMKENNSEVIVVNDKIQNPYFMDKLVIFPTLDGKVVIINTELRKKLRTAVISYEDFFNNVISFDIVDNKIIASTNYKILSLSEKEIRENYEIRDLVSDGKTIYIDTKQGEIISLNSNLDVISKVKLPFAHFLGMIHKKDKLYLLEKEGYIIVVDKNSFNYKVYEIDLDDGMVFVSKDKFYIDDQEIFLD